MRGLKEDGALPEERIRVWEATSECPAGEFILENSHGKWTLLDSPDKAQQPLHWEDDGGADGARGGDATPGVRSGLSFC